MFTNWDSVQFQFDKKMDNCSQRLCTMYLILSEFSWLTFYANRQPCSDFFCSARRYRLSFKQRYQPTNKKKWFFHIPRQAMSTPNDLCLFALRHWMSSAHFFFCCCSSLLLFSRAPHFAGSLKICCRRVLAWSRTTRHSRKAILSLLLFSDAAKTHTPILLLHFAW